MSQEKALFLWLEQQYPEMVNSLLTWCRQNSGSYNNDGLAAMLKLIESKFSSLSLDIKQLASNKPTEVTLLGEEHTLELGDCLLIRGPKKKNGALKVLLTGHMDTVFPVDSPFQSEGFLDQSTLNAPGCADMKGGLLVIFYALSAFEQSKYRDSIEWTVFINADEELGSIGSKEHLRELAKQHHVGLVYEPSMDLDGTFAGARKGSGKFTIVSHGKSAHAGREFDKGRNAICLLSEVITDVNKLNDQRENVTLNIGLVQGGVALNAVPDIAVAKIDVRLKESLDQQWVLKEFDKIISKYRKRNGYALSLTGAFSRAPKPMSSNSKMLFSIVEKMSAELELPFNIRESGGCCDGNNLQEEGLAVVDTLGVVGANIHSNNEKMLLSSLVDRSKLSLKLLIHLATKGLGNE